MSNKDASAIDTPIMFDGTAKHGLFPSLKDQFPTALMTPASEPFQFAQEEGMELPESYQFDGQTRSTEAFFVDTDTSALLVIKDGAVRFERYALTGGRNVQWTSFSVAKSFVSALIGIAVQEGHIADIEDPISRYVAVPAGSAYDGVRIKDVLQMSSGATWSEDYSDPNAEIHRMAEAMGEKGSLDDFVCSMTPDVEPGSLCRYNSGDTQVLGMLLVKATGRSITDYRQEKLYTPLGMESAGYWLQDSVGLEMAFAGMILTARDFAKIGELFRNKGLWNNNQIVPQSCVTASATPDAPHLLPGKVVVGGHILPLGYGYQWWVPEGDCGEFCAIGVYNQFVFVDPSRGTVIVKLSANRTYGTTNEESENQEMETVEFLRAIARELD